MATDRVIYQSESLYTSKLKGTGASDLIDDGDLKEINRVQDMSYNLEVSRTDVNEFGQLAALSREVTEPPTVGLDFSYYLTDGTQEQDLGFNINSDTNKTSPITTTFINSNRISIFNIF